MHILYKVCTTLVNLHTGHVALILFQSLLRLGEPNIDIEILLTFVSGISGKYLIFRNPYIEIAILRKLIFL